MTDPRFLRYRQAVAKPPAYTVAGIMATLAEASRLDGVNPADVTDADKAVWLAYAERKVGAL